MPGALQKITHRIHGQRKLLVPSITLRRDYLETAHLGQIESELQAIRSRGFQIDHSSKAMHRQMRALPNYDKLTRAERKQYDHMIMDDVNALSAHMRPRFAHLKAIKKQITQFKLN